MIVMGLHGAFVLLVGDCVNCQPIQRNELSMAPLAVYEDVLILQGLKIWYRQFP